MQALRSLTIVAALLAAGLTSTANAQDPQSRARQLYGEAQALFDAGNYTRAEASFRAAYNAVPNPVVLKAIAACQEHSGNVAGAAATPGGEWWHVVGRVHTYARYRTTQPMRLTV